MQRDITVVDLGDPRSRQHILTSVQELTGNWRAYPDRNSRGPLHTVRSNTTIAPTQQLGTRLAARNIAGFLTPSTHNPTTSNLVVFPAATSSDPAATLVAPLPARIGPGS